MLYKYFIINSMKIFLLPLFSFAFNIKYLEIISIDKNTMYIKQNHAYSLLVSILNEKTILSCMSQNLQAQFIETKIIRIDETNFKIQITLKTTKKFDQIDFRFFDMQFISAFNEHYINAISNYRQYQRQNRQCQTEKRSSKQSKQLPDIEKK